MPLTIMNLNDILLKKNNIINILIYPKFIIHHLKLLFFVCLPFFMMPSLYAQNVDKIVGIVGDEIVLKSDVEIQQRQMEAQGMKEEGLACALFEELLLQKLLVTQAEVDSIMVSEDEIEGELDQRIRYFVNMFDGDPSRLEAEYNKSIIEIKDEFRENIKEQLLSRRMQQEVVGNVKVTPAEVKAFYEAMPSDSLPFYDAEVEMAQIVVLAKVGEEQKEIAKKDLTELKERIEAGEDFGTLAYVHSDDKGSAENDGDLGFMSRSDLVNEFAAAAFNLENGEISNIVETEFGLHLIQMIERRGEKANLRHILIRPEITSYDLEKAKAKLNDVRNKILTDSISFNKAVNKYSDDKQTKNNGGNIINPQTGSPTFPMDQLDISLFSIIDTMSVNQVSKPAQFKDDRDGSFGYRIIQLRKSTDAHKANLTDDYERIKIAAENDKQQKAMSKWISRTTPDTYIFIEEDFKACTEAGKWLQ